MSKEERDQLAERVGTAVRAGRKFKGLSQEALAASIDVSVVTLSNIERAENVPTLAVFLRLVRALDLNTDELAEVTERGHVDHERRRLEANAIQLVRSIDQRDLRLLVGLANVMRKS